MEVGDARYVALREWSRIRDNWVNERTRLLNRTTDVLRRYFPQILDVGHVHEAWVHALLRRAPTPAEAQRLQARTVEKILSEHSIRRVTAEKVVGALRAVPLTITPALVEVLAAHLLHSSEPSPRATVRASPNDAELEAMLYPAADCIALLD